MPIKYYLKHYKVDLPIRHTYFFCKYNLFIYAYLISDMNRSLQHFLSQEEGRKLDYNLFYILRAKESGENIRKVEDYLGFAPLASENQMLVLQRSVFGKFYYL